MPPVSEIRKVTHAQSVRSLAENLRVGYPVECLLTFHQPRNSPFQEHALAKLAQRL
jgi:hypothetical protein